MQNMGQRHNRKRTRSRPRNRDRSHQLHSRDSLTTSNYPLRSPVFFAPTSPVRTLPANAWQQQYTTWQHRTRQQQQEQEMAEGQRLRLFGGEMGEEASLCAPMLRVVMDLFDDIDYVDP